MHRAPQQRFLCAGDGPSSVRNTGLHDKSAQHQKSDSAKSDRRSKLRRFKTAIERSLHGDRKEFTTLGSVPGADGFRSCLGPIARSSDSETDATIEIAERIPQSRGDFRLANGPLTFATSRLCSAAASASHNTHARSLEIERGIVRRSGRGQVRLCAADLFTSTNAPATRAVSRGRLRSTRRSAS